MKQVEMWKWFKLPVDCELIPTDCTGDSDSVLFSGAKVLTAHHVEKVEIAINSYDTNQALIAKQAEQIEYLDGYVTGTQIQNDICTKENDRLAAENEMLREALELSIPFLPFDSVAEAKAYQALKATKE